MKKYLLSVVLFLVSVVSPVSAATLTPRPSALLVGVEQELRVDVVADTEGDEINATEGSVTFPSKLFSLQNIRDGSSVITFWIEQPARPENCTDVCVISWSGVAPGGFNGPNALLFSFTLKAEAAGAAIFEVRNAKMLLNDGQGTVATLRVESGAVQIAASPQSVAEQVAEDADRDPPNPFTPEIARHPAAFENQWFVAFSTQDKGSGIDYYEVKEGSGQFERAESPHLLRDQSLNQSVTVRAVDRAGNIRDETAVRAKGPDEPIVVSAWLPVAGIGALFVALGWWVVRRKTGV